VELRQWKSLSELAGSGSITRAAAAVHLTPAAVHKQLKQLEAELGVPLYERRDGAIALTDAAHILMPYLREILAQQEGAVQALEEWKGVRRGLVRIGSGPSLAIYLLPEVLKRYNTLYPGVDVDVQTGSSLQLLAALETGDIDLALIVAEGPIESPSIQVAADQVSEIVLVTARADGPSRCRLASLGPRPFLLFRKGSRIERLIDRYFAEQGLTPNVIMRFDSAEALRAALLTGLGVAMLPAYTVDEDIRRGTLRRIRQREPPLRMHVHLLQRRGVFVPPAVQRFVDCASPIWSASPSGSGATAAK
jgi:DNA-binding transcriptional LysR family regulator